MAAAEGSTSDEPYAMPEPEASMRSTLVGLARSAAIRYSIMLPKLKAANFFQPEDHVSHKNMHSSLQGARLVGLTHTASIFGSGTLLFVVQERALRLLEPSSGGDFGSASALSSALAGGCGGAAYGLAATATHAWLGTGALLTNLKKWSFLARALPYTLPRDMGGFALYFGVYNLSHQTLSEKLAPASASDAAAPVAAAAPTAAAGGAARAPPLPDAAADLEPARAPAAGLLSASSPAELAGALTAIAVSGALSGLCTYIWRARPWPKRERPRARRGLGPDGLTPRMPTCVAWHAGTPWDTLYKKAVGWRHAGAPLWSLDRFVRSPRGLKAVGIGALTWSAYELADAGLRYVAADSTDAAS